MNIPILLPKLSFVSFAMTMSAHSAAMVLDSFTDTSFSVENRSGPIISLVNNPIADKRLSSSGGDTQFFISQSAVPGTFTYRVAFRGEPNPNDPPHVDLVYYKNTGALPLLGVDQAVLRITSVTGLGEIKIYYNGASDVPVYPILSSGDLQIPIRQLPLGNNGNPVGDITIQINARSANFAITLDEIALIPEPRSTALCLAGTGILAFRRRSRACD